MTGPLIRDDSRTTMGAKQRVRQGRREVRLRLRLLVSAVLLLFGEAALAVDIPTPDVRLDAYSTGARPFGVDLVGAQPIGTLLDRTTGAPSLSIVVANSAEDSVSIFRVRNSRPSMWDRENQFSLELAATVRGIAAPYGVAGCNSGDGSDTALVTSPADGSLTVLSVPDGKTLGKLAVGPQPRAVACFSTGGSYKGVVSNTGDDSLVVFDVKTLTVEARITGVAGGGGAHGISIYNGSNRQAWVAGTNADALTLVDLATYRVLATLRVRGATSVHDKCVASSPDSSIICYDEFLQPSTTSGIPTPADFASFSYVMLRGYQILFASTG